MAQGKDNVNNCKQGDADVLYAVWIPVKHLEGEAYYDQENRKGNPFRYVCVNE